MTTAEAALTDRPDTGLTGFYKDMTVPERRAFWACAAGWGLDNADAILYPLVITTIMAQWTISSGAAGIAVI